MKHLANLLFAFCLLPLTALAQDTDVALDRIVAIVDESVITERDLDNRIQFVRVDFRINKRDLPDYDTLRRQVLDSLIGDSLLLQEAKRRGLKITDNQLNQTMQRLARRNDMSLSDFRRAIIADGLDYDKFRERIRRDRIISALRNQYAQRNASISDAEVDEFIANSGNDEVNYEYHLSHILIAVPDAASPEVVGEAEQQIRELMQKLDAGEPFGQLANTFSTGESALRDGDLGWRKKAEIPSLFTDAVLAMDVGGYAGPIRSASGFHIVHLKERRNLEQVLVRQTRSRHILIKPNELVTEEDARARLLEFRERILGGEDFARLAKLYSVDYGSGVEGGDVGWTQPGTMVREYEAATDRLEVGELSQPFKSQFGWHLVEVTGRKTVDETAQNKRNKIRSQLLQQKQQEVFDLWKRQLRDEAYVVFPDSSDA